MEVFLRFGLLAAILNSVWISGASSFSDKKFLGIDPLDFGYYKTSVINCKDGSKKFNRELLNDEFCDCLDGTDEPGTSACPEGKFYCRNAGFLPIKIFSSRVNDGICDCCDGSDEYNTNANCTNTCWEAGKVAKLKLSEKIEIYRQGVILRSKVVKMAWEAFANDEADLEKLKNGEKMLKELVEKLEEQKKRIEKIEEEERLEDERLKKEKEENIVNGYEDGHIWEHHDDNLNSSNDNTSYVGEIADNELQKQEQLNSVTEELSREELGRLVASRWTGEAADQETDKIGNVEVEQIDQEDPNAAHEEHIEHALETEDDDRAEDDDNDDADDQDEYVDEYVEPESTSIANGNNLTWLEKLPETIQNVLETFNFFEEPVNISEAEHIRNAYDETNSKLDKVHSRISSLGKKLKHDFGKDREFYLFYGECFESRQNKYVYKVCPFRKASQEEGYKTTSLGDWDKFQGSYRLMQFSNGERCWNGPDRSLKVRLRCGLSNELGEIGEPSRCEYAAMMSTPAVCRESRLKELEEKLRQMNIREPLSHDEL